MKSFIFAIVLVLAFCVDSWAINLRPYMQTPPEVQVFAKRVIEDGGQVVDLEYAQKLTRLAKQLDTWSNVKFLGDANFAYKSGVTTTVAKLYDLSGNNSDAVQATAAYQPVWTANVQNGKAGVVFTVASTHTLLHNLSFGANSTFVALASRNGGSGWVSIISCALDPIMATTLTSNNWGTYQGAEISTSYSIDGSFKLMINVLRAVNDLDLVTNGTVENKVTGSSWVSSGRSLGSGQPLFAYYLNGTIIEVIMFNIALTTAQRTALESFVNAYYSIY